MIYGDTEAGKALFVCACAIDAEAARQFVPPQHYTVHHYDSEPETDWSIVAGRRVLMWPFGTDEMLRQARDLAQFLLGVHAAAEVKLIIAEPECGPGWIVAEGWPWSAFFAWARERVETQVLAHPIIMAAESAPPGVDPVASPSSLPPAQATVPADAAPPSWITAPEDSIIEIVDPHDEWAHPADFWGQAQSAPDLNDSWLPPEIAPFVVDQAALIGCDPAMLAINCLSACAAAIRGDITLQMMEHSGRWRERALIWTAICGDASTKKGPAQDAAFRHFVMLDMEARSDSERELQRYDVASRVYEAQLAHYVKESAKGPAGEEPIKPDRPLIRRMWSDDATKEALAKLLSHHERGKILLLKDELASWFGSWDRYAANGKVGGDRADYLSAYESKSRFIDRVDGGRAYHVPNWAVAISGGIQPSVFSRIAGQLGEDGMLARFIIINARAADEGEDRKPDRDAIGRWEPLLAALIDLEAGEGPCRYSPEAQEFRRDAMAWVYRTMRAGLPSDMVAALGKWEGLYGRLCLIYHAVACAGNGARVIAPEINTNTATRVWAMMENFLWPHLLTFYLGVAAESDGRNPARELAEFILARDLMLLTFAEMRERWMPFRNFRTPQSRKGLMDLLISAGWVRGEGGQDLSGRMPTRYAVNPRVHSLFVSEKTRAKAQRRAQANALAYRLKRG